VVKTIGLPVAFLPQGERDQILAQAGFTVDQVVAAAEAAWAGGVAPARRQRAPV
jgi:hypothetical protein